MNDTNWTATLVAAGVGIILVLWGAWPDIRAWRQRRRLHDATLAELRAQQALDRINDRS